MTAIFRTECAGNEPIKTPGLEPDIDWQPYFKCYVNTTVSREIVAAVNSLEVQPGNQYSPVREVS